MAFYNGNLIPGIAANIMLAPIDEHYNPESDSAQSGKGVAEALATITETTVDQTYNAESKNAQSGKAVAEVVGKCVPKKMAEPSAPFSSVVATNNIEYDADGLPTDESYISINAIGTELGKDVDNNIGTLSNSIPRRDSNGNLFTGTPIDDEDCANKKYVDDKISKIPSGGAVDQEYNEYSPNAQSGIALAPLKRMLYQVVNNSSNNSAQVGILQDELYTNYYNKVQVDEQIGILESLFNSKLITSIWASYKYEFDYNALYLLKSNSGNKDIEILDGDGNNVIGSLKSSYCLLILPKKTYQRTEWTVTQDGHDREVVGKVNCIFAGMTDKSALTTMDKIQMLQFEVDPTKKISVTPSSSGISIFKVAF